MTNEQILKKAIEKAVKNGYLPFPAWSKEKNIKHLNACYRFLLGETRVGFEYYILIFSHSFAKAFFGEEIRTYRDSTNTFRWQYDLQAMVLEKEPLKYIEEFL